MPKVPIKIAFFGSDQFSVQSLAKLSSVKVNNPEKIESIHVITRSVKSRGRKSKSFIDLPIGNYCNHNDIPILRADSSSDILKILDNYQFDLTIAVSYGKLIPEEFLSSCRYGGLNVHPSLLPKYSGSSPIQYALLNNDGSTGCTIQTLHPNKFDKGDIIEQSEEIPILLGDNYETLESKLGEVGSKMLVGVVEKVFNGGKDVGIAESRYEYSLATKITPSHRLICWEDSSIKIKRLNDALGPLTTYVNVDIVKKKKKIQELQKVILDDIQLFGGDSKLIQSGSFALEDYCSKDSRLIIKTADGCVTVGKMKFQYCNEESPLDFMKALPRRTGSSDKAFLTMKR